MREPITPLKQFIESEDFISRDHSTQIAAIDGYFKKLDSILDEDEKTPEIYRAISDARVEARQPFLQLKFGESISSMLPEGMRDPENVSYMATYLQRYFGATNGGDEINFSMPGVRLTPMTEEEVSAAALKVKNGDRLTGVLPSEKKRVSGALEKMGWDVPDFAIHSESDDGQDDENLKKRREEGYFYPHDKAFHKLAGPAIDVLKAAHGDAVERAQSKQWTHVNDDMGTIFSFRRIPIPGKNVWELDHSGRDAGDKSVISKDFTGVNPGSKEMDEALRQFARDNISRLNDSDDTYGGLLGIMPTGLSTRERAEALIGANDRGFWKESMANFQRNITSLPAKVIGGGAAFLDTGVKGLYHMVGKEDEREGEDSGLFTKMAVAYNHMGDMYVRGNSLTAEDRELSGFAKFTDVSAASDALVNFGSVIAQVALTKKAPATGISLLATEAASSSYQEILRSNLDSGAPLDVAARRAAFGGSLEGAIIGAIQYGTGRLMQSGAAQIPMIRSLISSRLAATGSSGPVRAFLAGKLPYVGAAFPVTAASNVAGGAIIRFSSQVIQDIFNPEDDLGNNILATFSDEEVSRMRQVIAAGAQEDLVLGALGDFIFQGPRPEAGQLTEKPVVISDQYPVLSSGDKFHVHTGGFLAEFNARPEAEAFSGRLNELDSARSMVVERYQPEGSSSLSWRRKQGVPDEAFAEWQALENSVGADIEAKRGAKINLVTTDRAVSRHQSLADAIGEAKKFVSEFVLGREPVGKQMESMANRLMDKYASRSVPDLEARRLGYKEKLMQPTPRPVDDSLSKLIKEKTDELNAIPDRSSPAAVSLMQSIAKLSLKLSSAKASTKPGMTEASAEAASRLYAESLVSEAREAHRKRAEAQAEMVYGRQGVDVDGGVGILEIPQDQELARSIHDHVAIEQVTEVDGDGAQRTYYDLIFRQPTTTAPPTLRPAPAQPLEPAQQSPQPPAPPQPLEAQAPQPSEAPAAQPPAVRPIEVVPAKKKTSPELDPSRATKNYAGSITRMAGKIDTMEAASDAAVEAVNVAAEASPEAPGTRSFAPGLSGTVTDTAENASPPALLAKLAEISHSHIPAVAIESVIGGTFNGDFRGPGNATLDVDSGGNVVLRRFARDPSHLIKEGQRSGGAQDLWNTSEQHGGGNGVPTIGSARDVAGVPEGSYADYAIEGVFKIPSSEFLKLAQDGEILLGNIGESEIVISPAVAAKYLVETTNRTSEDTKTPPGSGQTAGGITSKSPDANSAIDAASKAFKDAREAIMSELELADAMPYPYGAHQKGILRRMLDDVKSRSAAIGRERSAPVVRESMKRTEEKAPTGMADDAPAAMEVVESALVGHGVSSDEARSAALAAADDPSIVDSARTISIGDLAQKPAQKKGKSAPTDKALTIEDVAFKGLPEAARKAWSDDDIAAMKKYAESGNPDDIASLSPIKRKRAISARIDLNESLGISADDALQAEQQAKQDKVAASEREVARLRKLAEGRAAKSDVDEILSRKIDDVIETTEDGVSKVVAGDEVAWIDESPRSDTPDPIVVRSGDRAKVSVGDEQYQIYRDKSTGEWMVEGQPGEKPQFIGDSVESSAANLRRRNQSGQTVIFGELADLAIKGVKAGWNAAKYIARVISTIGSKFGRAAEDVWRSVVGAHAEAADRIAPVAPPEKAASQVLVKPGSALDLWMKSQSSVASPTQASKNSSRRSMLESKDKAGVLAEPVAKATDGALAKMYGSAIQVFHRAMGNIHPELGRMAKAWNHDLHERVQRSLAGYSDSIKAFNKMSDSQWADFVAAEGEGGQRLNDFLAKHKMNDAYNKAMTTSKAIYNEAKKIGVELGFTPDYFPRAVKDYDGLRAAIQDSPDFSKIVEGAVTHAEELAGRELSQVEKDNVIGNWLVGSGRGPKKASNQKARKLDAIPPELAKFYHKKGEVLEIYASKMAKLLTSAEYTGQDAASWGRQVRSGIGLADARGSFAGSLVYDLYTSGKIDSAGVKAAADMIHAASDIRPTPALSKAYMAPNILLAMGDVTGSVNQLIGIVNSAQRNGFLNTAMGLIDAITGKPFSRDALSLKSLGLDHTSQQMMGDHFMKKVSNVVWVASARKLTDAIEGNTFLGAFARKVSKMSPQKLLDTVTPWARYLTSSPDTVAADMAAGNWTRDARFIAFNEITEVRPTGFASMPLAYIKNPAIRFMYGLRIFGINQLDYIKAQSFDKIAKGDLAGGMGNLVYLLGGLTLAGASADEARNWMLGRKKAFNTEVQDNLLKQLLSSQYQVEQAQSGDLRGILVSYMAQPIVPFAEKLIKEYSRVKREVSLNSDVVEAMKQSSLMEYVPVAGRLAWWRFSGKAPEKQFEYMQHDYGDSVKEHNSRLSQLTTLSSGERAKRGLTAEYDSLHVWGKIRRAKEKQMKEILSGSHPDRLTMAAEIRDEITAMADDTPSEWRAAISRMPAKYLK